MCSREVLLWEIADEPFGPTDLHQVEIASWTDVRSIVGKIVDYLDGNLVAMMC